VLKGWFIDSNARQLPSDISNPYRFRRFTLGGEVAYKGGGAVIVAEENPRCFGHGYCVRLPGYHYYLLSGYPDYDRLQPADHLHLVAARISEAPFRRQLPGPLRLCEAIVRLDEDGRWLSAAQAFGRGVAPCAGRGPPSSAKRGHYRPPEGQEHRNE
jgi:hypothetical protein